MGTSHSAMAFTGGENCAQPSLPYTWSVQRFGRSTRTERGPSPLFPHRSPIQNQMESNPRCDGLGRAERERPDSHHRSHQGRQAHDQDVSPARTNGSVRQVRPDREGRQDGRYNRYRQGDHRIREKCPSEEPTMNPWGLSLGARQSARWWPGQAHDSRRTSFGSLSSRRATNFECRR